MRTTLNMRRALEIRYLLFYFNSYMAMLLIHIPIRRGGVVVKLLKLPLDLLLKYMHQDARGVISHSYICVIKVLILPMFLRFVGWCWNCYDVIAGTVYPS